MSDLFETLIQSLQKQALSEDSMTATLSGLGQQLVDGGIPVSRISLSRTALHPTIGLMEMQWNADTQRVQLQEVARSAISPELLLNSPFGDLTTRKYDRIHADLNQPEEVARYAIFRQLADNGVTAYLAFSYQFGREQTTFSRIAEGFHGASLSFCTTHPSGFTVEQLDGLERLVPGICICSRVDSDRLLANGVIEAYLGRVSARKVLAGLVARGDGEQIDCAIFYSDLRNSLALSQSLDLQTYLDTLNAYFDCTAAAVVEHGGEVLKFIGDGVLAIFPFDDGSCPRQDRCAAALASAHEAFTRAAHVNRMRDSQNLPRLGFGVALHVGQVIYGNVGTQTRLDFTATGPAVGLAARVEGLTRQLDMPLLATKDFADLCSAKSMSLPPQKLRGFNEPVEIVGYDT